MPGNSAPTLVQLLDANGLQLGPGKYAGEFCALDQRTQYALV